MTGPFSRRSILGGATLASGIPLAGTAHTKGLRSQDAAVPAVPLFSQLATHPIPAGVKAVVTAGHTVAGVGAARYVFDPTSADPAAIARRFPLTAALTRDGRLFRLDIAGGVSALALGAAADGVTDDAPAIQQFLDSLGSVAEGGADTPRVTIDFSDRRYRLEKPLRIVQNLVALHAEGATLDGGGRAPRLLQVDHDNSVNSPTGVAITGRWFLRGSAGDAVTLASAPLFTIGHLHATGIAGDVVRVEGCVGGTVAMIEAYDCKGLAYRETAMVKRFRGDEGGKRVNCINNRVDAIRAYGCGGAWLASESWHPSVGRIDVESSTGVGVVVESCLSPSFRSIYEEDHALGILIRSTPRVFDADFPTGFALIDTLFSGGALVDGNVTPCSIEVRDGARTVIRAGRVGGDVRIGTGARGTRIGRDVELLGRIEDAGPETRIERHSRRIVTVRAGEGGADVAFDRAVSDDRYLPLVRAIGWTGKPSPGALLARGVRPTRGGFKLELLAVVDAGCTVTFLAEAG
jgi:hypothetical protein